MLKKFVGRTQWVSNDVIPAKAGIQNSSKTVDSRLSGNDRSLVLKDILPFILLFVALIFPINTDAKSRSGEEAKAIESRILWSHEFPGAVIGLTMTPSGYLELVARDGKGKKSTQTRYVMNYANSILWQGEASASAVIADSPNIVMLEAGGNGLVLHAVGPTGGDKWTRPLDGIPASIISDATTSNLVMVLMPYAWPNDQKSAHSAKLVCVNLATGVVKWNSDIGEVKGALTDFGNELAINGGKVWWGAGGVAFAADIASGKLLWKNTVNDTPGAASVWTFDSGSAALARGGSVSYFEASSGLKWQKVLKKVSNPGGLAIMPEGVVASVAGDKNVVLTLLNKNDGATVWEKSLPHNSKKYGFPPKGMAVYGGKVAIAAERHVTGFDIGSGEKAYDIKLKKDDFLSLHELRSQQDHFVLVGFEGATAYNSASGDKMWEQTGFIDPIAEVRAVSAAAMSVAMANLTVQSEGSKKAWKEYSEGSRDFTSAAQLSSMANDAERLKNAEQGKNIAAGLSKWVEIDLEVSNRRLGPDYAEFYRHRGSSLFGLKDVDKLDMALVNLLGGTITESGTKKAEMGCVGQIMIDPVSRKMVQAYRQMKLACSDENVIEMYNFE